MLRRLKIRKFKSIRDADIEFGGVNLFIGANGAGKSNVLEAVGIASAMVGRGITNNDFMRKGIRLTPSALMKSAFKRHELPKDLSMELEFSRGLYYSFNLTSSANEKSLTVKSEQCVFDGVRQFGRSPRGGRVHGSSLVGTLDRQRGMWDQIQVAYKFDDFIAKTFSEFSRFAIYAPQTDFLRGREVAPAEDPPIGLHGEGLQDAVYDLLKQTMGFRQEKSERLKEVVELSKEAINLVYLPGWTDRVGVGIDNKNLISSDVKGESSTMIYFRDRFMSASRNRLSAYDGSEGTLFLLFASVLLGHLRSPKYFGFDNVDSALNPSITKILLEKIIKIVSRSSKSPFELGPKQVFMTSHNPTSLDAFDVFEDSQRVFIVSREEDSGETVIERLQPPRGMNRTEWAIAKNGRKLSQLWLDGDLPGMSGAIDGI